VASRFLSGTAVDERTVASPPAPKRIPETFTLHGDSRVDEYHWLREKTNPDVIAHLEAENAYTQAATAATAGLQAALYDEILGHIKQDDRSAPYLARGYYYYTRTEAGRQYRVYCRRPGSLNAPEEIVLDLNALAEGKAFLALGAFEISDDGNLLAYSLDETGYRQYTLYVEDLRSGSTLGVEIECVDSVVWAADGNTLVYTTEHPMTKRPDAVWRRELDAAVPVPMFTETDELFGVSVERSRDGHWIFVRSEAKDTTEYRWVDANHPADVLRTFAERRDGIHYDLDEREGRFYIRTNEGAPDFRIFTTPIGQPQRSAWSELLGQRPGTTITGMDLFAGFIAVAGRRDGRSSIELLAADGEALMPLEFDEADYVARIGQNREYTARSLRIVYESLVTPPSVYDVDVESGVRTLVKQIDVPGYDPAAYVAQRFFASATDGTRIPVSIVQRRDVVRDGSAPLLLYAYGSYGISIDPSFSAARLPLLDRSVIFAIAHIRGGGEYGEAWRLAGNLFNKRTTFRDFIDCASALVDARYTSPERLVIQGGSAGGLLVGAVINARPELFRAAIAAVPFVDVLTTMLDPSLPLTTSEYREWGNPQDADAYAYMRSYSPVDNVSAQPYPAVLVEVAYNDSQVPYWEGVKFAAKLRANTTSGQPILVKANMGAGHGGSSGRYDALKERAFDYAFVLNAVGIGA
jgi:oligopeptidase B